MDEAPQAVVVRPRSIYTAIFVVTGIYVFIQAYEILSPILLSFLLIVLLSLALNPVVSRLRSGMGGRTVAMALLVLLFLGVTFLTALGFYSPIKRSTAKLVERLPEYWERIQKPLVRMEQRAAISEERLKREVRSELAREEGFIDPSGSMVPSAIPASPFEKAQDGHGLFWSSLGEVKGGLSSLFTGLASNAASLLIIGITVFVGVIFTLLNPPSVLQQLFALVPERHHARALRITARIVSFVPRWATATLLGMVTIGVMVFLAMWPIFGWPDALVLGLIGMIFECVPYVGPLLSGIPALLLAVGQGGSSPMWVVVAYVGIQLLEHNVISPLIVAGQLQLHPVNVIFSVLLCMAAFGILGVVVAVPLAAIFRILHEEIYRAKFLPNVSDEALAALAREALKGDPVAAGKT